MVVEIRLLLTFDQHFQLLSWLAIPVSFNSNFVKPGCNYQLNIAFVLPSLHVWFHGLFDLCCSKHLGPKFSGREKHASRRCLTKDLPTAPVVAQKVYSGLDVSSPAHDISWPFDLLLHSWSGARSLAPATPNDNWTSKGAPYPSTFTLFQIGNLLPGTTTACNFSSLI